MSVFTCCLLLKISFVFLATPANISVKRSYSCLSNKVFSGATAWEVSCVFWYFFEYTRYALMVVSSNSLNSRFCKISLHHHLQNQSGSWGPINIGPQIGPRISPQIVCIRLYYFDAKNFANVGGTGICIKKGVKV